MTTRIACLASGGGRTVENLADVIAAGELDAELVLLLTDRPGVGALERAERLGIPARVLPWKEFDGPPAYARAAFAAIEEAGADLVLLAGFLRLLQVPDAWLGRVLNIHPALLPAYGGKGYYGDRVHRAVLEAGETRSGCTVHYVTNEYDSGPIVLQEEVEVRPDDDVDALAARVFEAEKRAYPEAVRRHLRGAASFTP